MDAPELPGSPRCHHCDPAPGIAARDRLRVILRQPAKLICSGADRQLAAVIAGINGFAWTGQMYVEGLQDDDEIMRAIVEYRAALTDQPSGDGMRSAFPESIGRLTLGEKLSSDHPESD